MNDELFVAGVTAVLFAIVVAIAVAISYFWNAHVCDAAWKNSGYQSDYGLFTGCIVSRDGKRWVPEGVVREVE